MRPHAKRQFGQHFLRDTGILNRIERLIQPAPTDCIVEIGAGDGSLSQRIAPSAGHYLAIEVDDDLIPALSLALAPYAKTEVLQADILDMDLGGLIRARGFDPGSTRLIGNLPYNIASPIIRASLRLTTPVRDMTFMVQLEVAQRITSSPGSRAYGYLAVDCRHRADVRMMVKVPPACFSPRPRVMSAVIQLRPRGVPTGTGFDMAFDDLVKAAFSHRRKTIENSLRKHEQFGLVAVQLLERADIEGKRRAEELSVEEYERLAATYCALAQ